MKKEKERTLEEVQGEIDELLVERKLNDLEIKYLEERLAILKIAILKNEDKRIPNEPNKE